MTKYPKWKIRPSQSVNLLIDGTYFSNKLCLVLYRDNTLKYTQLYRLTDGEWFDEIAEDLSNLLSMGLNIESITCDGHKAILKAIKIKCPHVTLQRCLFHIQNMCKIWLKPYPKSLAAIELKYLVGSLHRIFVEEDSIYWNKQFRDWYLKHKTFVEELSINPVTGRKWRKHKLLYRCYSVIKKHNLTCFNI